MDADVSSLIFSTQRRSFQSLCTPCSALLSELSDVKEEVQPLSVVRFSGHDKKKQQSGLYQV